MAERESSWKILRDWLLSEKAGSAIIRQLESDDPAAPDALRAWVLAHKENSPPMLATLVTGGNIDKIVNIAQAGVVVISEPRSNAPVLSLPKLALSERTRLNFAARRTQLVGRESEFAELAQFLSADKIFLWWMVVGPAGVGKSRLALDFCIETIGSWECGFLPRASSFNDWSDWKPSKPTLVVVDYAADRAKQIRTVILALAERNVGPKIRLLLLERAAGDYWWKDFVGYGKDSYVMEECRYAESRLVLPLAKQDVERIIKELVDPSILATKDDRFWGAVHANEFLDRPLFASFAADAINAGRDPRQWDHERLVRDVLEREIYLRWLPGGVKAHDIQTLMLATMVGGLPSSLIHAGAFADNIVSSAEFNSRIYEMATGGSPRQLIEPLEPDVVGEFFVLEQIGQADDNTSQVSALVRAAWSISPAEMASFIGRAESDFPNHPSVPLLILELPDDSVQQYYWIFAAYAALKRMNEKGALEPAERIAQRILVSHFEHPAERVMRQHYGDDTYESFFNIPSGNIVLLKGPDAYSLALQISDLRWSIGGQLRTLILELTERGHLAKAEDLTRKYEDWVSRHAYDPQSLESYTWTAFEFIRGCHENHRTDDAIAWYCHVRMLAEGRPKSNAIWDARQKGLVNLISSLCQIERFDDALVFMGELIGVYSARAEDDSVGERIREAARVLSAGLVNHRMFDAAERLLADIRKLMESRPEQSIVIALAEVTSNIAAGRGLACSFDASHEQLDVLRSLHWKDVNVESYLRWLHAMTVRNLILTLYKAKSLNGMSNLYAELQVLDESGATSQSLVDLRFHALMQWLCTAYRMSNVGELERACSHATVLAAAGWDQGAVAGAAGLRLLAAAVFNEGNPTRASELMAQLSTDVGDASWIALEQALGIDEYAKLRQFLANGTGQH